MKEFIINTVKEAGKIAMDYLGNAKISMKKPKDFVTEADIAVEKFIVSKIKETYPNHNIIGEEEDYEKTNSDFTWYIDPIDGTANYAHADIHFAISVGIKKGNEIEYGIVYLPMINELYFAQKNQGAFLNGEKIQVSKIDNLKSAVIQSGISTQESKIDDSLKLIKELSTKACRARDLGFCAGQLAFVAAGRSDGLVKVQQHPWDYAAGILLITEAGGKVTDENNKDFIVGDKNSMQNIIASNNLFHDQLVDLVNNINIDMDNPWW